MAVKNIRLISGDGGIDPIDIGEPQILNSSEYIIGRNRSNQIIVSPFYDPHDSSTAPRVIGNQHTSVSRKHLGFNVEAGGVCVRDLGSTNGTIYHDDSPGSEDRPVHAEGVFLSPRKSSYSFNLGHFELDIIVS